MNSFAFHETTMHGTKDFPCEYHYVDTSHPRNNMPFHWHKEWEIIHILDGTFTAHADEAIYTAKAGDILLIRDGMLHGGFSEHCIYECIIFDLHDLFRNFESVKKYLRPIYRKALLPAIYYPAAEPLQLSASVEGIANAFRRAGNEADIHSPLELAVLGHISLFFAAIMENGLYTASSTASPDTSHKIDSVKPVLEYIEQHYSDDITLKKLADIACMNENYFCRFFRSITHQTPMEYVNMYRIEKAAQLLQSTGLPVINICLECGFNDSSNFIKVFRKYKGMTPGQYRRE